MLRNLSPLLGHSELEKPSQRREKETFLGSPLHDSGTKLKDLLLVGWHDFSVKTNIDYSDLKHTKELKKICEFMI